MFFAGAFGVFVGSMMLTASVYRWRHPDGEPTGWIRFSERSLTVGAFRRRPLPPRPMGVFLGVLFIVVGGAFIVRSLV